MFYLSSICKLANSSFVGSPLDIDSDNDVENNDFRQSLMDKITQVTKKNSQQKCRNFQLSAAALPSSMLTDIKFGTGKGAAIYKRSMRHNMNGPYF